MTKRVCTSNSFLAREVRALLEMHACVLRGGDARHIAQSVAVCSVIRKFRIMARRHDGVTGPIDIDGADAADAEVMS